MKVYLVGQLRVDQWEWYKEYRKITEEVVKRHSGKYLVKGVPAHVFENSQSVPSAIVVIEFPSAEHAMQWYQDPDYQPMIALRKINDVETELLLLDGEEA